MHKLKSHMNCLTYSAQMHGLEIIPPYCNKDILMLDEEGGKKKKK